MYSCLFFLGGAKSIIVTNRNYPKFAIQEMVVNSEYHRDYSIKGTEIQIKMFDDRLVFESPGKLPGLVRAENIRHTHFSRNPKIAQFLKAYSFVKEFGEGIDRICNELESRDSIIPSFHADAFILKATLMAEFVEDVTLNVLKDSQGVRQGVRQGVPQDEELDSWIEHQLIGNPRMASEELASLSGRSSKTIIRHIAKMPHIK